MARYEIETILSGRNEAGDAFLELGGQIEAVSQKLDTIDGRNVRADIDVNILDSLGKISEVEDRLNALDRIRSSPTITVDTGGAQTSIQSVRTALEALPRTTQVTVNVDTGGAISQVGGVRAALDSLPRTTQVTVSADVGGAISQVGEVRGALTSLPRTTTVNIAVDTGGAISRIGEVRSALTALPRTTTVNLAVDIGSAISQIGEVRSALEGLRTVTVDIRVNIGDALANIEAVAQALRSLPNTVRIDIDVQSAGAITNLLATEAASRRTRNEFGTTQSATGALSGAFRLLIGAVEGATFGMADIGGLASSTSGSIGGLVIVVGAMATVAGLAAAAIAPLTAGLVVLLATLAPLVAGFGLLALAVYPVVKAIQDGASANKEYEDAQKKVGTSTDALEKAQLKQQQAQTKVNTLTQEGGQAAGLSASQQNQLRTAHDSLEDAQLKQGQAAEKVNQLTQEGGQAAGLSAAQQKTLASAHDSVEDAQLKQAQAQEKVNQLYAAGKTDTSQYQTALNQLETANQNLGQANDKYAAAQAKANQEMQSGSGESSRLTTAQSTLESANQNLQQAQEKYAGVQSKVNEEVSKGSGESTKLTTAQNALDKANQDVTQKTDALNTAQSTLNNTTNTQQGYVQTLIAGWQSLKQSYAENFLQNEALGQSMTRLGGQILDMANRAMPSLASAAKTTADAVSSAFSQLGTEVSGGSFQTFLDSIGPIVESATLAVGRFGAGFLNIINQANPLAQRFMDFVAQIAQNFLEWTQSEEGRARIEQFLNSVVPVAEAFYDVLARVLPQLIDLGIKYGPTVAEAIRKIGDFLQTAIGFLDGFLGVLTRVTGIAGSVSSALDTVQSTIQSVGESIHTWILGLDPFLAEQGALIYNELIKPFVDAYNWLLGNSVVPDMINGIYNWFKWLADNVGGPLQTIYDAITKPFQAASDAIWGQSIVPEMAQGVIDSIGTIPGGVQQHLGGSGGYTEIVSGRFSYATEQARVYLEALTAQVIHTFGEVADWANNQMSIYERYVIDAFTNSSNIAKQAVTNMASSVINGFVAMSNGATNALNQLVSNTQSAFQNIINMASQTRSALSQAFGGIVSSRPAAYGGVVEAAQGGRFAEDGTPGMPIWRAQEGAHYVEGPTMMDWGGQSILYGEALSPGNREYAFPGSDASGATMTFITEEPGFDSLSFGLWSELGERKGYLPSGASDRTSSGASASNAALISEVKKLREEVAALRQSTEGKMDENTDAVKEVAPALGRRIPNELKNNKDWVKAGMEGQKSQLEQKLFSGR